jgi:hypothetical protein
MDTNTIKKQHSHTIPNKVYLKFNEQLNGFDTLIDKTVYYDVKEYQKAYDKEGNEIGDLKVGEHMEKENVTDTFNYLDYKDINSPIYIGCQTLHFNNRTHLIPLHTLNTMEEVLEASLILNKSKVFKNTFNCVHRLDSENHFRVIGEEKGKIHPSEIDDTINSYIEEILWGNVSQRLDFETLTDGETYNFDSNIQVVGIGHSRMVCYISSDSFDDTQYKKSIKEVKDITLDIWGKVRNDIHTVNYIYYLNKGLSKISEGCKLIYKFHISYNYNNDKKVRIEGVVDNKIIKKEYGINSPEVITEIRSYISSLIKDGVYITTHQKKKINKVLDTVKDEIMRTSEDFINFKKIIKGNDIIEKPVIHKESQTYLMKNRRNGLYKIGKSTTPAYRERTLQAEEPEIEMVKVWDDNIEDTLHKKYKKHRVRGEWFKLTKPQVKYICTHY